ncbi:MAG: hypothetical protein WCF18_06105 [Chthoniobacteraceae bacterium]
MNLEKLRHLAGQADELAAELRAQLARAEATRDPLGVHIFAARASYRRTSDRDTSKSGKRTETELQMSYSRARQLGFRGGQQMWDLLMRCGSCEENLPTS